VELKLGIIGKRLYYSECGGFAYSDADTVIFWEYCGAEVEAKREHACCRQLRKGEYKPPLNGWVERQ